MNTIPDVEKEIVKAWDNADSADMFEHDVRDIFIVQQFFRLGRFQVIGKQINRIRILGGKNHECFRVH